MTLTLKEPKGRSKVLFKLLRMLRKLKPLAASRWCKQAKTSVRASAKVAPNGRSQENINYHSYLYRLASFL